MTGGMTDAEYLAEEMRELREKQRYHRAQSKRAERDLAKLPPLLRRFYSAQYSCGLGSSDDREGRYAGLVCRCCNTWQECGHDDDCPLRDTAVLAALDGQEQQP